MAIIVDEKYLLGFKIEERDELVNHNSFYHIESLDTQEDKKMGEYVGRVAVRTTGSFNIKTLAGTIQGISHKYCSFVHKKDGYSSAFS